MIERARRGSGDNPTVDGEDRIVARAEKLVLALLPVIRAPQVSTLGSERDDGVVGVLDHPRGALFADDLPAVDAIAAEGHFNRGVRRDLGDIARLDPFVFLACFWWEQEIE